MDERIAFQLGPNGSHKDLDLTDFDSNQDMDEQIEVKDEISGFMDKSKFLTFVL